MKGTRSIEEQGASLGFGGWNLASEAAASYGHPHKTLFATAP